ncbi:MAG: hypothetical protein M1826_004689 [Phylliscum demangeonii]|nr:MAG: hypothetical protein M1826_004689 [Phylliscum demangeonii]
MTFSERNRSVVMHLCTTKPQSSLLAYVECIQFAMKRYRVLLNFLHVSKMKVTATGVHVARSIRYRCLLFVTILRACADRLKQLEEEPGAEQHSAKVFVALNDAKKFYDQLTWFEEDLIRENSSIAPVEDYKMAELSPLSAPPPAAPPVALEASFSERNRSDVMHLCTTKPKSSLLAYIGCIQFSMERYRVLLNFLHVSKDESDRHRGSRGPLDSLLLPDIRDDSQGVRRSIKATRRGPGSGATLCEGLCQKFYDQLTWFEEDLIRENSSIAPVEDNKMAELSPLSMTILAASEHLCATAAQGDDHRGRRDHVARSIRYHCLLFVEILRACADRLKQLEEEPGAEQHSAKVFVALNDAKKFYDQLTWFEEYLIRENTHTRE